MTAPVDQRHPGTPIGVPCPKGRCEHLHDPRKCTGHKDLEGGDLVPCGRFPRRGLKVCDSHGGAAPQVKQAARREALRREIEQARDILDAEPITDPLRALQLLAGQVVEWMNALAERVDFNTLRYESNIMTEQARAEVQMLERAMDRCNTVLATIAKLNIDERLARVDEATADIVVRAIEAGLATAGVSGAAASRAREEVRRQLTLIPGGAG